MVSANKIKELATELPWLYMVRLCWRCSPSRLSQLPPRTLHGGEELSRERTEQTGSRNQNTPKITSQQDNELTLPLRSDS